MAGKTKIPNATDHAVGQKIRSQRIVHGLSQTELGERVGITFQQIQKYEKGSNRVSAGRLKQIAEILKVPVSFFFEGAAGKGAVAENINAGLSFLETAASVRLVRAFAEIEKANVRSSIVALVEGIASSQRGRRKDHRVPRREPRCLMVEICEGEPCPEVSHGTSAKRMADVHAALRCDLRLCRNGSGFGRGKP